MKEIPFVDLYMKHMSIYSVYGCARKRFCSYHDIGVLQDQGRQDDIMDEKKLSRKFGVQAISTKFKYFLIRQQTLLAVHEATTLSDISKGALL